MTFEFVYATPPETSLDRLQQGDILFRGDDLSTAIDQAHSYYATEKSYSHFMVVTQSCDLVRRKNRPPKSRYITLAAVRPVGIQIDRLLKKYEYQLEGAYEDFPLPICQKEYEDLVKDRVENLLHNTHEGFFFLPADGHAAIPENLCAFLPLTIALRSVHYDVCLRSKVAQLSEIFQAKVGWLTGNQYSRIGTPDLEENESEPEAAKERYYDELIYRRAVWLSSGQFRSLKTLVKKWKMENPGTDMDEVVASGLLKSIPNQQSLVAERIINVLLGNGALTGGAEEQARIRRILENDRPLGRLIQSDATA